MWAWIVVSLCVSLVINWRPVPGVTWIGSALCDPDKDKQLVRLISCNAVFSILALQQHFLLIISYQNCINWIKNPHICYWLLLCADIVPFCTTENTTTNNNIPEESSFHLLNCCHCEWLSCFRAMTPVQSQHNQSKMAGSDWIAW